MLINRKWLMEEGACSNARELFLEKYPDGTDENKAMDWLLEKHRIDWQEWFVARFPQFFDKLEVGKMSGEDIRCLLQSQPQFFDKLEVGKMNGWDISCLLQSQPQFFDKLEVGKMSGWDIGWLLQYQPQLREMTEKRKGGSDEK